MFFELERIIKSYPEKVTLGTPVTLDVIKEVELLLRNELPKSYKLFLQKWGWLEFGSYEYLGIISTDIENPSGVVKYNIDERTKGRLPDYFLIVKDEGDYGEICLDLRNGLDKNKECQIIVWDPWNKKLLDVVADSFNAFLERDIAGYIDNVM